MMKTTNITICLRSITALCVMFAVFAATSMVALAMSDKKSAMGELTISGSGKVMLNGERASNGRTVFSASTITTTEDSSATIKLGKLGYINLSPNSNLSLTFSENSIAGNLSAGKIKVFNNEGVEVRITTADDAVSNNLQQSSNFTVDVQSGTTKAIAESGSVSLNNGKSSLPVDPQQTKTASNGNGYLIPIAIFGGAVAAAIIYVAVKRDNNTISGVR